MLGSKIKAARESRKLTQAQLGEALGLTQRSIARIEAGQQEVSGERLKNIAAILRVSVAYLMDETDDPTPIAENAEPTSSTPKVPPLGHSRFNERLRTYRHMRKMGQETLAEQMGISRHHISAMEGGRLKPTEEQLQKLAEALDVPLEYLAGKDDFSKPATQSGRDLDYLIKELAAKNPDLVWRLRNTSQSMEELNEETKQSLADGISYVLGLIELSDLPKRKRS